jgi:hypothetical protein
MNVPRELIDAAYSERGNTDLTSLVLNRGTLVLAWVPLWYSSDACLPGGVWDFHLLRAAGSPRLKSALEAGGFHGLIVVFEPCFKIKGRIDRIVHPKLGELRSVVRNPSDLFSFTVTRPDGSTFSLDDEDRAGWCEIPGIEPDDWALRVTMTVDPAQVAEAVA